LLSSTKISEGLSEGGWFVTESQSLPTNIVKPQILAKRDVFTLKEFIQLIMYMENTRVYI